MIETKEAAALLDELAQKFKSENLTATVPIAYILVRAESAQYYLKTAQSDVQLAAKARDYLDECLELVESIMTTSPPPIEIQASVYRISA